MVSCAQIKAKPRSAEFTASCRFVMPIGAFAALTIQPLSHAKIAGNVAAANVIATIHQHPESS
jgi:hypothetical protein